MAVLLPVNAVGPVQRRPVGSFGEYAKFTDDQPLGVALAVLLLDRQSRGRRLFARAGDLVRRGARRNTARVSPRTGGSGRWTAAKVMHAAARI